MGFPCLRTAGAVPTLSLSPVGPVQLCEDREPGAVRCLQPQSFDHSPTNSHFCGAHPCSQPWISIPLGTGIFFVAIPGVTPKPNKELKQ